MEDNTKQVFVVGGKTIRDEEKNLYIWGGMGVGKTTLVKTIAERVRAQVTTNYEMDLKACNEDIACETNVLKKYNEFHLRDEDNPATMLYSTKYLDIRFYQAVDLFEMIKASWNTNASTEDHQKIARNCDLLIIDDIGSEKVSEWTLQTLTGILSHRMNNGLQTIYTSNLPIESLKKKYRTIDETAGVRLMERIEYDATILNHTGENKRKKYIKK